MTTSINTNISAYYAQNNLRMAGDQAQLSIARLSSGNKIIRAADDVAGLSIGTSLRTTVSTLRTALKNATQASTLLQVADGGLGKIGDILQRQKALATQANSGTLSTTERGYLNQEFQSLKNEIDRLVSSTKFNSITLLDGSTAASKLSSFNFNSYQAVTTSGAAAANRLTAATGIVLTGTSNAFREVIPNQWTGASFTATNSTTGTATLTVAGISFVSNPFDTTAGATTVDLHNSTYGTITLNFGGATTLGTAANASSVQDDIRTWEFKVRQELNDFNATGGLLNGMLGSAVTLDKNSGTFSNLSIGSFDVAKSTGTGNNDATLRVDIGGETFTSSTVNGTIDNTVTALVLKSTNNTKVLDTFTQSADTGNGITSGIVATTSWTSGAGAGQLVASNGIQFGGGVTTAAQLAAWKAVLQNDWSTATLTATGAATATVATLTINGVAFTSAATNTAAATTALTLNNTTYGDIILNFGSTSYATTALRDAWLDDVQTAVRQADFKVRNNVADIDASSTALSGMVAADVQLQRNGNQFTNLSVGTISVKGATTATSNDAALSIMIGSEEFSIDNLASSINNTTSSATSPIVLNGTTSGNQLRINFSNIGTNAFNLTDSRDVKEFEEALKQVLGSESALRFNFANISSSTKINMSTDDGIKSLQQALNKAFGYNPMQFQVGVASSDIIELSLKDSGTSKLYGGKTLDLTSQTNAITAADQLDAAIQTITALRADVGGLQSRFTYAAASLDTSIQNLDTARAGFLDTDVSDESTKFAQEQVLMQASISVLAQANQLPQNLLKLIG